jgi:hypothetical protein
MSKYDGCRGTAVSTLTYYIQTLFEKNGLGWDRDNDTEVGEIVDSIIDEAVHRIKEELSKSA